jgi:hypothetical protein
METHITKEPSDTDNAAPDWMVITRGRYRDNTAIQGLQVIRKAQEAKMRAAGYIPLADVAERMGLQISTLRARCRKGTMESVMVGNKYWIKADIK